ncbi:slowpoke-binding protein-like [Pollicipes pollicipes]|uniref:slowpoke-binding protein-like n=1 Tax=Pollicipes pollicipes TaxID=41117 RepID=UPI00188573C8|nr:slowpoke-binding protein-like [Pollicipes pollicipes]
MATPRNHDSNPLNHNTKWRITLFNLYKKKSREQAQEELLGHDVFNYRDPRVNYDKWPRKLLRTTLPTLEELAGLQPPPSLVSPVAASRNGTLADGYVTSTASAEGGATADVTHSSVLSAPEQQRSEVASQVAGSLCRQYLARSDRYQLVQPLNDLGCRSNKHWFLVQDLLVKTERLLTITSVTHRPPLLQQSSRAKLLKERLMSAKHPYLLPVLDADLIELPQGYPVVIIITPRGPSGSLRDIMHKTAWDRDWSDKYEAVDTERLRLPLSQVRRLSLQLVEALLHLRRTGFAATFGHLHAGNIMVQNGVARLADLEAALLEYEPCAWLGPAPPSDELAVGALIYQMASGRQTGPRGPTPAEMALLDHETRSQLGPVMEFIFDSPGGRHPSLDMLPRLEFFRDVQLRELARRPPSLTEMKVAVVGPVEPGQPCAPGQEHVVTRSPQRRRKRSSSMPGGSSQELQEFRRMHEQFSKIAPH